MWWHLTVTRAGNREFLDKQTTPTEGALPGGAAFPIVIVAFGDDPEVYACLRPSELRDLAARIRAAWPENTALEIILTAPGGHTEEL
jgi:hypothetical protein